MSETKPPVALRGHRPLRDIKARLPDWKAEVIFDVGANIGQSSASFLVEFPEATIHAFEPVPQAFETLREAMRGHGSVHPHNAALGSRSGTVSMRARGKTTENRIVNQDVSLLPGEKLITVAMETGDAMAQRLGVERISYLKIDTEGHDHEVVQGFSSTLARTDFVQVEASMNPYNTTHAPFRLLEDLLRHHGFLLFHLYDQALEFKRGGRPVLRRCNPVFINGALVDLTGLS